MPAPRTLYAKLVDDHTVRTLDDDGHVLLYIDRQVLNEYTSPQAFSGLRDAGRRVRRPRSALAVVDHVNPTVPKRGPAMADPGGQRQADYLAQNCQDFGIELFDVLDPRQGIEHVVAPEQGFILPGMVVAAGDSHTTTYGALGALGFGIGTSEIEHLLATQTLVYRRLKTMRVRVDGKPAPGTSAKDIVMALIRQIGAAGAAGYVIEFVGSAITSLGVAGRMTICNMAVEAGARGALVAPDAKVYAFLRHLPRTPQGAVWEAALRDWQTLRSDDDAVFDRDIQLDSDRLEPLVTWGTSPDQAVPIGGHVPNPTEENDSARRRDMQRAIAYMGLTPGMPVRDIAITHAFIGSCTNARIEDLREVADILRHRRVAHGVRAIIVPSSSAVRRQAEREGLDRIFVNAGFEWRQSGCSMCLAMNGDALKPGERCASSTNRNFEGRQGTGARTHLMSPVMVAAAAIYGRLTDVRELISGD
ncbi:3-isopropylmalate dehydratase large subunit [Dyella flava]|uniref:3-isopropylmalate dehydratase large subunit n=1 Tax=Dyella flava TaxID=1920170 RepID=A0ABS2JZQ2_9GAMM|nr:3-isopropylmalate dehydratase large subunit [Dyella flava]MBM7124485.1 3-isopropylmalate dehydratase large subunit [Dyella flava]GLQ51850.1 3-isopropylmalate dehydratase large subunit [Dyella flava]